MATKKKNISKKGVASKLAARLKKLDEIKPTGIHFDLPIERPFFLGEEFIKDSQVVVVAVVNHGGHTAWLALKSKPGIAIMRVTTSQKKVYL